ncbi:FkbM family methyltransferase [Devosia sp. MC532]|uniref:FkbM family methyltransferase n=1 Tax=Devosia sp. MC532 TaxID=2799788 RepID=UPI0018F479BD|nr:FkbM family methyltransferase [Devosia sp. MC532]MBJ7579521.1 FkbM family methyltransferase [Devosia sp. MC532]
MKSLVNSLSLKQKTILRDFARRAGLEVSPNTQNFRDDLRLAGLLKLFDIKLVLDVGANRGQFAQELFKAGYAGKIVSFEALPDAHATLLRSASKSGRDWDIAPRVALSAQAGVAQFHVTATDTASSLRVPGQDMVASTPSTRLASTIQVQTARLDDLLKEMGIVVEQCFIKLDVQGAETLVLAGASNAIASASGLMTELSLIPLYEGEPSAQDVLGTVYEAGFEVWDIWQGFRNPQTYRLNQIDIVCFKSTSNTHA